MLDKSQIEKFINEKFWLLVYYTDSIQIEERKNLELKDLSLGIFLKNNDVNEDKLLKVRFFNQKCEILIWKYNESLKSRSIFENEIPEDKILDREYFTWGNKIDGDYIKEESRDIKIKIPESLKKNQLKYKVRNYFDYNEKDGLICFTDYRLLGFYV